MVSWSAVLPCSFLRGTCSTLLACLVLGWRHLPLLQCLNEQHSLSLSLSLLEELLTLECQQHTSASSPFQLIPSISLERISNFFFFLTQVVWNFRMRERVGYQIIQLFFRQVFNNLAIFRSISHSYMPQNPKLSLKILWEFSWEGHS